MTLFTGEPAAVRSALKKAAEDAEAGGKKAGIIDFGGNAEEAARLFFKELRRLDSQHVDVIFAAGIEETGIGVAVMNRMRYAANGNIINV